MIGLVYRLGDNAIIARVDDVISITEDSIIGKDGNVKGIDLSQASSCIVEASDFQIGDILPVDTVDQRDLITDPDSELAEAINAATTLPELKAALLGNGRIARVKGKMK